jgi:nucleoside-diphosphate-sugar epimerase
LAAVSERGRGQVYIVTDGRVYSTREIYGAIAANLGRREARWAVPLPLIRAGARIGDLLLRLGIPSPLHTGTVRKLLGSAWYDDTKIRAELGFSPRYDLEQALPEIIADMGGESAAVPASGRRDARPALNG